MADLRVKDVSSLLSNFFDADKLSRGEKVSSFFASWASLVGPRLAAHSRVMDVHNGLLVIEAEHPGWIQLLQMRQSGILEDVARRYPELGLRGIVFRLADASPGAQSEPPKREEPLEPAAEKESEKVATTSTLEDVADPSLRALLSSLRKTMQGKS
jgi:hypothetical protein